MDGSPRLFPRILKARERDALQLIEDRPGITLDELQDALSLSDAGMRRLTSGLRGQVRFEPAPLPQPDPLEPPIRWRAELPPEVRAVRAAADEEERRVSEVAQPRIDAHVATYRMALDTIDALHQEIADRTNIDLTAATRWAAMWQLAGRTLGLARAVLVLAEAGIGDEALPVGRAQHECSRLLEVVTNRTEVDIVVRWLQDDEERIPKPHEVRKAIERTEEVMNAAMRLAGRAPLPTTRELSRGLYHRMSGVSHNRRAGTMAVVGAKVRQMVRGRHPSAYGRAAAVSWAGTLIEEAVSQTGSCLTAFLGPSAGPQWVEQTLLPTLSTFEAVRHDQALDAQSIARAAHEVHPLV